MTRMEVRTYLGLVSLPRTGAVLPAAALEMPAAVGRQAVHRPDGREVLLLWQPEKGRGKGSVQGPARESGSLPAGRARGRAGD